ncbi:PEP-CTERM sorting domain-containing protein [Massilia sp. SR12]
MKLKQKAFASILIAAASLAGSGAAQAGVISQWGSNVIGFSSQYNTTSWAAAQALGAPDRPTYGDIAGAWAPQSRGGTLEWLSIGFDTAVYATGAVIREVSGNGFLYQIDAIDSFGNLHQVWSGADTSAANTPYNFAVNWSETSYTVKGLKVYIDTSRHGDWEEIDAIQLVGNDTLTAPADVPEPASLALLGLGLLGLSAVRRKKR